MSDWWEAPYKGGPMVVPASYFPRPLYPPDNASKPTPKDGPDVLAYKRTLCRLGRWEPWEPANWDDAYSNKFAHGRGPNVADSGIEGFQRQMAISATGNLGQATFNSLASARVPEGPHRDEMAMDANAVNLIREAYAIFGGQEEPPPSTKAIRQRALEAAMSFLGYKESPAGSNHTVFGDWYGMDYNPWCAMAVCHWFTVGAEGSLSFVRGSRYSYCPYILNDAKAGRYGLSITTNPVPGDVVLFDWQYDSCPDHVGLYHSGTPSSFQCVEGNTSTSDNSNGGEVMRRTRSTSEAKIHFVRVAE